MAFILVVEAALPPPQAVGIFFCFLGVLLIAEAATSQIDDSCDVL